MIIKIIKGSRPAAFILLLLMISSCGFKESPALHKLAPLPDNGGICRVAVLPFINETDYPLADTLMYKVFVTELNKTGNIFVSQEGDVRRIYRQIKVVPGRMPFVEQLRALAGRLGVQVVVTGNVVEMKEKASKYSSELEPAIAVVLRIIDADTGRTLWTTYHRREGRQYRVALHFGKVNTVTALAKKIVQEIIETWLDEGIKECGKIS